MLQTFHKRFLIILLPALIILSLGSYFVFKTYNSLRQELIQKSSLFVVNVIEQSLADKLGKKLNRLTSREKSEARKQLADLVTRDGSILSILVIDKSKTIILSNDRKVEGSTYLDPEQVNLLQTDTPFLSRDTWDDEIEVMDVILPIRDNSSEIHGHLRVVLSIVELESILTDLPKRLIPLFIVISLLLILSLLLTTRAYRQPLDSLNTAISKIEEEDFSYRVKYQKKDEFTDTFVKLNKTIEKVGYLKEGYKKAEKRILSLLHAVNDSILVMDPNKYVSSFNEATLKLFKTEESAFSSWFIKLLDINVELNGLISKSIREAKPIHDKQLTIFLPDDSELLVKMSLQLLKEGETVSSLVLTFKDLRLINELENNLLRSMKFGVITNLASSISHEIKNPLSALALHAEVLSVRFRKMEFKEKAQVEDSLNTLQNEVKRLNRIIQQFLSLARPSRLDLHLININTVAKDVLNLVQQQAQEQKISIEANLSSSLERIYGDEDQLKQVLLNIVLNAFAVMDPGGKLSVRSRMENNRVYVDVQDTGRGMPKEIQEKVFDLYFTTKKDGGGIGLAVCKNIMEAHEGRIFFKSVINKGTTFTIQLPVKDQTTIRQTRTREKKLTMTSQNV